MYNRCKGRVYVACKVALDQSTKVSLQIVGNYNRPTTQISLSLESGHEDVCKLIVLVIVVVVVYCLV